MTTPPPILDPYEGILILDNDAKRAYLQQQTASGQLFQTLMMLDPDALGVFDWGQVTEAWQHYASDPNLKSGVSTIKFEGFWKYPEDSTVPVLHLVKYLGST
jgi:hypothetical protein